MFSNGHCSTCEIETACDYEYKPCDCCAQRKFVPKDEYSKNRKIQKIKQNNKFAFVENT